MPERRGPWVERSSAHRAGRITQRFESLRSIRRLSWQPLRSHTQTHEAKALAPATIVLRSLERNQVPERSSRHIRRVLSELKAHSH